MWVLTAVERAEVVRRMRHVQVRGPFRGPMIYSNIGYTVAGEALAAAAGRSFELLLRDYVIRPLGLTGSTWAYEQSQALPNVAAGHARMAGRQQPTGRETQRDATAPAGAVQSSVRDLTRWLRLHLNNGVLDGRRYVSEAAMRELHSVQATITTTPEMRAARMVEDTVIGYGLGWQRMDYRGHPFVWHTGSGNGHYAYMALLPRDRIGVVVLVNTWAAASVHLAILNRIVDEYLGFEPRDWAGEELQRARQIQRQQDAAVQEMTAMRSADPAPLALAAYAGTYDEPRFGPLHVRLHNGALTLQMGDGQIADLEHHGNGAFFTAWRDPFFREYYGTHIEFEAVNGVVVRLNTRINRDTFTAERVRRQ
jgi:CubicO group peptidase (beta-lactamase class C family)